MASQPFQPARMMQPAFAGQGGELRRALQPLRSAWLGGESPIKHRFVIFVMCWFAGWPTLKIFNIQGLEFFFIAHLIFLLFAFGMRGFHAKITGLWRNPGPFWGTVMFGIFAFSVASMRLRRYPPMYGPYFLQYPLLVVVMRYGELFLAVFYGMYAAELMRKDHRLRDFGLRWYLNSALYTACLSIFGSWMFHLAHVYFWVNLEGRGQGEFPEGGPWGLYLLTAAMVAAVMWQRGMFTPRRKLFVLFVMCYGFYLCRSKACAFCALMIFLTQIFFGRNWRQKLISIVGIAAVCGAAWYVIDVPAFWRVYSHIRQTAEVTAYLSPADANISYGRVAGSAIVPRMIEHHPITGIGFGNYPVMRNDPAYLGIIWPAKFYDLPGLGLLSVAAEIGIPSLLGLYAMMFYPAFRVRKVHGAAILLTMALSQPYVHLMGAQITLFYPWLTSGFVLSFLPLAGRTRAEAMKAQAGMFNLARVLRAAPPAPAHGMRVRTTS